MGSCPHRPIFGRAHSGDAAPVFRGKALAARWLDELAGDGLDHFVAFGSVAAVLPMAGGGGGRECRRPRLSVLFGAASALAVLRFGASARGVYSVLGQQLLGRCRLCCPGW